jgi:hypothetical protein
VSLTLEKLCDPGEIISRVTDPGENIARVTDPGEQFREIWVEGWLEKGWINLGLI